MQAIGAKVSLHKHIVPDGIDILVLRKSEAGVDVNSARVYAPRGSTSFGCGELPQARNEDETNSSICISKSLD